MWCQVAKFELSKDNRCPEMKKLLRKNSVLGGFCSKVLVFFNPGLWGNDPNLINLANIFSTGWFNHQLDCFSGYFLEMDHILFCQKWKSFGTYSWDPCKKDAKQGFRAYKTSRGVTRFVSILRVVFWGVSHTKSRVLSPNDERRMMATETLKVHLHWSVGILFSSLDSFVHNFFTLSLQVASLMKFIKVVFIPKRRHQWDPF